MRIRKRFPLSSLSDPQLISCSLAAAVVQPRIRHENNLCAQEEVKITTPNHSDPQNQTLQQPSDEEIIIGTDEQMKQKEVVEREAEETKKSSSNDTGKGCIYSADQVNRQLLIPPHHFSMSSSSCQDQSDRWGEGDRIVPLKKRKGSFERMILDQNKLETLLEPKMKSKTNKKCLQVQDDYYGKNKVRSCDIDDKVENGTGLAAHNANKNSNNRTSNTSSSGKKIKRGNVIMEGSRCSRVNGRGWRCCQQTLVGYSLCEHHLGKGRLRSITTVRNSATATSNAAPLDQIKNEVDIKTAAAARFTQDLMMMKSSSTNYTTTRPDDHIVADDEEEEEEDEIRKTLMISRKKRGMMKIGAVKARSISSLLGQTDNAGACSSS